MSDNIVIVQARMGSSRLPGKSMMLINNKPMLDYLIDTLLMVFETKDIYVATSINEENDVIRAYAENKIITCYSGDENNVASRYYEILKSQPSKKTLYRICGDSPYYDTEILNKGIEIMSNKNIDFASSMPNKGYPMGCNLEVIKTELFLQCYPKFNQKSHFEHVMPYFYENMGQFNNSLIGCEIEGYAYEKYKFSVDTEEDFKVAQEMLKRMDYNPWKYDISSKFEIQKKVKNICLSSQKSHHNFTDK
jgi:spore coat polysaccharide biosynthesis protein SpsF